MSHKLFADHSVVIWLFPITLLMTSISSGYLAVPFLHSRSWNQISGLGVPFGDPQGMYVCISPSQNPHWTAQMFCSLS